MSGRLNGKKIVVTAAGQGIGKATAIAFHKEGAHVTATDLNEKTLAELNKEYPDIKVTKLDSTDNNAILEFTKTLDKVDVLFNAVENKKIYAAGLDVFNNEPNLDNRYLKLDNCFVLPHVGSATHETRLAMSMMAVDNIYCFFNKKPLISEVV
jgi:NAD(P)-dependent dehydrogenase (short-subunit alcohol dehydrogenase family)